MQNIHVRPFCADDLSAVHAMVQSLAKHHDDVPTLTLEALARDALGATPWLHILVAVQVAEPVGYAALCPHAQLQFGLRGMDIQNLYVVPDARSAGVGRALITAATETAKTLDCAYITVGTHPDNHAAAKVYLATGFQPLPKGGPRFGRRL